MSVKKITANALGFLKAPHVHIKDEAGVLQKINKIALDGASKLQVVTDFDLTLTKQHEDGAPILSSFGIFTKCKKLPKQYKKDSKVLYLKYRAVELDPKICLEDKVKAMYEWYMTLHNKLQGCEFDHEEIEEVTRIYGHSLRDRAKELFTKLKNIDVPVLVFSAGLGDVVQALLRQQEVLHDNVNIISNFLEINGNTLNGFKNHKRLIHAFNKNEHSIEHDYFKILHGRTNVILMGDMIGDAAMADGVKDTETVLKIGFLYENAEENLQSYIEAFDIVLVDDQTMNVILDILNLM
ncbi:7-methylguanosine phosphate-specific 5'-nucleotidase-like [Phymastichus coffea]|uniref:7-methylguanosine phosphate-specific 5'-nucleotidase-like n=1 Tax=Phymastichus coffea TaxID=108790 RepID=UPI00273AC647|nr:7-methylguanosine phosphate-specific 5'-nucleotidase-like [Phymastichus coffea]